MIAVAALIVAGISAAFSGWSIVYSRRSARSSGSSAESAATALGIDADRRHTELTPRFRVTCDRWNTGSDKLRLIVELTGPPQLCALDELTLTIRDDHHWRAHHEPLAGGPTREQIAAQVWGRWRLTPGSVPDRGPGADEYGRTSTEPGLPVGEALSYQLEPTWPPPWSRQSVEDWQAQMGNVLKFTLECKLEGYRPWRLPAQLACDGLGAASTTVPQGPNS